jgi:hypothetical protein
MELGAEPRPRRRGCIWVLLLAAVPLVAVVVLAAIALAAPDLGPAPGGSNDGDTQDAIVAAMATSLGEQLLLRQHGVITLSEHDLTVLVRENNPDPSRFQNPEARIRRGLVVIDAHTKVGPFTVDAVGKLSLSRTVGADSEPPRVTATFEAVEVGGLGLPDFAAKAVQDRIQQAFDLQDVLASNQYLSLARSNLDCVLVASDGVRLGFHRPGSAADPAGCG